MQVIVEKDGLHIGVQAQRFELFQLPGPGDLAVHHAVAVIRPGAGIQRLFVGGQHLVKRAVADGVDGHLHPMPMSQSHQAVQFLRRVNGHAPLAGQIGVIPVSYTHLDVYKRQTQAMDQYLAERSLTLDELWTSEEAKTEYLGLVASQMVSLLRKNSVTGTFLMLAPPETARTGGKASGCLLYTSRCV